MYEINENTKYPTLKNLQRKRSRYSFQENEFNCFHLDNYQKLISLKQYIENITELDSLLDKINTNSIFNDYNSGIDISLHINEIREAIEKIKNYFDDRSCFYSSKPYGILMNPFIFSSVLRELSGFSVDLTSKNDQSDYRGQCPYMYIGSAIITEIQNLKFQVNNSIMLYSQNFWFQLHDILSNNEYLRQQFYFQNNIESENYLTCANYSIGILIKRIRDLLPEEKLDKNDVPMMDQVFNNANREPLIKINNNSTETEKNEQRGFANILKGLVEKYRNKYAHHPTVKINKFECINVLFIVTEAMDVLDHAKELNII